MPETYEVGVAAIVALLILREVFTYLRTQKQNNGTGTADHRLRQVVNDALATNVVAILRHQVSILDELKSANVIGSAAMMRAQFTLEEVKQEQARTRENLHDIRDILNVSVGRRQETP